jgi:phosphoribosyl 1,2-cyclic phosphodiesterase
LLRFASLASGSGGNCLVADADGSCVLIDCGLNLTDTERRLRRLGLEPADIDGMLITHEHGDHAHGVFDFAAAHNSVVYLTYGTMLALKAEGRVTEGVRMVFINGRQSEAIGGMLVIPFTVPHDAREPVQFVFGDGERRLGVLTDVGCSTPHIEAMLAGVDALVLECNHDADMLENGPYPAGLKRRVGGRFGHLENGQAAGLLGKLRHDGLQCVMAAHVSKTNNTAALAQRALARVLDCADEEVRVACQSTGFDWIRM